jgi:hypothetical protein
MSLHSQFHNNQVHGCGDHRTRATEVQCLQNAQEFRGGRKFDDGLDALTVVRSPEPAARLSRKARGGAPWPAANCGSSACGPEFLLRTRVVASTLLSSLGDAESLQARMRPMLETPEDLVMRMSWP